MNREKRQIKSYTSEQIRNGIFALNTRRFGTVAESLIKILANAKWGKDISHDLFDDVEMRRIEVKFSRALRANKSTIKDDNILEEIVNANDSERMFKSSDWEENSFDCNIQQVKKKEFDILYCGIFFSDKVQIFKITPELIDGKINYSDKQHKGNIGEGQFHLNNNTYRYHLENLFEKELTYEEILEHLVKLQGAGKLNAKILMIILLIISCCEKIGLATI